MTDSFPRQQARTQGFTLGAPRSFRVSPDGSRVAFLRSHGGSDPVTCLWVLDVQSGREHLVADPATLGVTGAALTAEERAVRERTRERATGIVAFAADSALTLVTFVLAGKVYAADLSVPAGTAGAGPHSGVMRPVSTRIPAFDPRPDPAGRRVAYVCEGALRVTDLHTGEDREIIGPAGAPGLTFGLAEFIAAEEMHRTRGYWWAPDGTALLVARVDETRVNRWYIADPANPGRPAAEVAYPAAGTPNADVSLLLARLDGSRSEVAWDRSAFPYLVCVHWDSGDPLIVVQTRDQRRMRLLSADPAKAEVAVLREDSDPHWVDIVAGVPARAVGGRIVWTTDSEDTRRLLVALPEELAEGASPVTPPGLQVREVLGADRDAVLFRASGDDPTQIGVWLYRPDGLANLTPEPGVHTGWRSGGTTVLSSHSLSKPGATVRVLRDGRAGAQPAPASAPGGWAAAQPGPASAPGGRTDGPAGRITSLAEEPSLPAPRPELFAAGARAIRTALLLPSWHEPGSGKLPVLLDPYGGPHVQRVLAAQAVFWTSQWFAEQGFAVVVADGRGTPGRGPAWDRAVAGDLAGPALDDQVEALYAAAARCGDLDLGKVAIRGWSFGGFLAAIAVLRRPGVFHAAVAGAPVTDQRLYDTHYTERYLGQPEDDPAAYERSSPITDAQRLAAGEPPADGVVRPLMLIHGLADDNVVVAHTLRLSAALLAAGYPHTVLPLSGVTHLPRQEEVAENLLLLQADFLRRSLGA